MTNIKYIAKKNKPELFEMGNYFPDIEGIATHKSEAKKLNMTENELYKNILKTQDTKDLKDYEYKEYLKRICKKLYDWIGDNEIWQETESSFDYMFDIIDGNYIGYTVTGNVYEPENCFVIFDNQKLQSIKNIKYDVKNSNFDKDGKHYEMFKLSVNKQEPIEIYMTIKDYRKFIDNIQCEIEL